MTGDALLICRLLSLTKLLAMKPLFLAFLLFPLFLLAQNTPRPRCADQPVYQQFDFWVGEWNVFAPNGKQAGTSKVERLLDSCVLLENWYSAGGSSGKSFNAYNAAKARWQQYWVDNSGGVTEYLNGRFENGSMIMETEKMPLANQTFRIMRMTFTPISKDKVRQHGQSSTDGGQTWKTDFDLEYRRKQ